MADTADSTNGQHGSEDSRLDALLEELGAAHALSAEVQRIAGIGAFVFDIETGIALWSVELRRIFGIENEPETVGLDRFLELLHPDDLGRVVSHFQQASELGDLTHSEHRIVTPAGECRHVEVRGEVVKLRGRPGVALVGTVQNVTPRREAEEKIAQKSAQVRQMEAKLAFLARQSAMGTMAATLAHELNQPLTAITNYSSGMRRLVPESEGAKPMRVGLEGIYENAIRAAGIIRRMRAIAQERQVQREPVNLFDVATDAIRFAGGACKGVTFQYRLEHRDKPQADRVQIEQVMVNLIRNACEELEGEQERVITIATSQDATCVTLSIADTGPGLPPDVNLFEATTSKKVGGTGIGLSICRTIIEAHGGRIWAENNPGGGATFSFTLPYDANGEDRRDTGL